MQEQVTGYSKAKPAQAPPTRREAHTFSFDWISRDFLRARTCKWLETCTEE